MLYIIPKNEDAKPVPPVNHHQSGAIRNYLTLQMKYDQELVIFKKCINFLMIISRLLSHVVIL